ncbi:MAG TPA: diacylglycerol kinase family protein [Syntrophomonadaceae bacterium]|nr:diacylglycerol kinase family protein [Syntrophomonadaceae bacterium]
MSSTDYRTMCIINPISGHKRGGQRWNLIDQALQEADFQYDITFTKYTLHAAEITQEALQQGYNRIVAVGGDGTLNEVVNGFFAPDGSMINPDAVLLLIPVGTGSDFARMFNIDSSPQCVQKLMSLTEGQTCDIVKASFCGWAGGKTSRYYINIADVGIGSETCARVNRNSKVLGGFWSFLLAALYTIITYKNRLVTVVVDGREKYSGPCCLVAVGNGCFFGGGMKIAPQALVNDGLLDIILVKNFGKMELFANMARVYKGNHLTHPKVEFHRGTRVKIISQDKAYLELEGEPVGYGQVDFEILPSRIKIIV